MEVQKSRQKNKTQIVILALLFVIIVVLSIASIFVATNKSQEQKWGNCDGAELKTEILIRCIKEKYDGDVDAQIKAYDESIERAKSVTDEAEIVALIDERANTIKESKGCDALPQAYREKIEGLNSNTTKVVYKNAAAVIGECGDSETAKNFIELSNSLEEENEKSY